MEIQKWDIQKYRMIDRYYSRLLKQPQLIFDTKFDTQDDFKLLLFNLSDSFYGKLQRSVLILKKKVVETLFNAQQHLNIRDLKMLAPTLSLLGNETQILLKEILLTFTIQMSCIEAKCSLNIQNIIKEIFLILTPSLKLFFAYKKYSRKIQNQPFENKERQQRESFSDKRIMKQKNDIFISNEEKQTGESFVKNIEKEMENMTIKELIDQYLIAQQQHKGQTLEVCRICSTKIKLDELSTHMYYCQKKFVLKQELNEATTKLQTILNNIKQQQLSSAPEERKEEEIELMKVFKTIVKMTIRGQSQRRSSLITMKKNIQVTKQLRSAISAYSDKFGVNELLYDFQAITTQKEEIQKNIEILEATYLNKLARNFSNPSSIKTLQSRQSNKHIEKTVRKSNFAKKEKQSSQSSSSSQESKDKENKNIHLKDRSSMRTEKQIEKCSQFENRKSFGLKKSLTFSIDYFQKGIDQTIETELQTQKKYNSQQQLSIRNYEDDHSKISIQSFEILQFLGKGAFGKVYIVRRIKTKDIYALKVIKINQNWEEKELTSIKSQHESFKKIGGDHLVKAPFSFSQGLAHFFVMEYMPGGDLGKLLSEEVYLEEKDAKFYLAQIILAIEQLHKIGIIHRDLKPENLVFDNAGHLKLTDFGLSEVRINHKIKEAMNVQNNKTNIDDRRIRAAPSRRTALVNNKTSVKLIGTPDYIAPQIINKISTDNQTIDWWSLGVMAYEIIIGVRPFCGNTIEQVIDNIIEMKIEWPQVGTQEGMITYEAKDLITKLLNKNFLGRLGAKGSFEIKQHPFFDKIDWENIKYSKPPIHRKVKDMHELQLKQQNIALQQQIYNLAQADKKSTKTEGKYALKDFIRVDLLVNETRQSAERVVIKKEQTLQKMRSFAKSLREDDKFSSVLSSNTSENNGANQSRTKFKNSSNSIHIYDDMTKNSEELIGNDQRRALDNDSIDQFNNNT